MISAVYLTLSWALCFSVHAGVPYKLVIEPTPVSTASPNRDNPAGSLIFASSDSVRFLYAVLRDAYGNWLGPCTKTEWLSFDTSVVKIEGGDTAMGEGRITRTGMNGQTAIAAWSGSNPLWMDTIRIALSDCCISFSVPRMDALRHDPSASPVSASLQAYDITGRSLSTTHTGNHHGVRFLCSKERSPAVWRIIISADRSLKRGGKR